MARADESDTGARPRRSRRTGQAQAKAKTAADAAADDEPSFEVALGRLEEVVDRLEGGELELEAALACFEEGVRLTRHCAEQLDAAERRIEILMKEGDDWVARPFADASDVELTDGADVDDDEGAEGWEG